MACRRPTPPTSGTSTQRTGRIGSSTASPRASWPPLLARENLGGRVQMIYFDPPYGMGYKSNFQVSTANRETPESAKGRPHDTRTVRAFRDTYERGIHSYLDLTLEKLVLMRELLADTGSLFMQIGDENVHRAAVLLDEVFGAEHRVAIIPYATTSGSSTKTLPSVADYLLWYAKDKEQVTYRQLYEPLDRRGLLDMWTWAALVELPDGTTRNLEDDEREKPDGALPEGAQLCYRVQLTSPGTSTNERSDPYVWMGGNGSVLRANSGASRWMVWTVWPHWAA